MKEILDVLKIWNADEHLVSIGEDQDRYNWSVQFWRCERKEEKISRRDNTLAGISKAYRGFFEKNLRNSNIEGDWNRACLHHLLSLYPPTFSATSPILFSLSDSIVMVTFIPIVCRRSPPTSHRQSPGMWSTLSPVKMHLQRLFSIRKIDRQVFSLNCPPFL